MSKNERWFFGFVTLWVVLFAGSPDLHDVLIGLISGCAK